MERTYRCEKQAVAKNLSEYQTDDNSRIANAEQENGTAVAHGGTEPSHSTEATRWLSVAV